MEFFRWSWSRYIWILGVCLQGPFPYYVSIFIDLYSIESFLLYSVQVYKYAYVIWK